MPELTGKGRGSPLPPKDETINNTTDKRRDISTHGMIHGELDLHQPCTLEVASGPLIVSMTTMTTVGVRRQSYRSSLGHVKSDMLGSGDGVGVSLRRVVDGRHC